MDNQLLVERQASILKIILHRPDKGNALTPEMLEQLSEQVGLVTTNSSIRAVIITGSGNKAFSAGFDISQIGQVGKTPGIELKIIESAFSAIRTCPFPVIAMVNGFAMGAGCDLLLNCDLRICSTTARFGITPAKLGVIYNLEGMERFIDAIGLANTKYLFFTGRKITATQAKEMGLVDLVCDQRNIEQTTLQLAEEIAANAPLAVQAAKSLLSRIQVERIVASGLTSEFQDWAARIFRSRDYIEGKSAFLEKRLPVFRGE